MSMLCTSNDVYRELTEPMREVYCLSALLRRISSWHVHLLRPRPRIDFWYRPTLGRDARGKCNAFRCAFYLGLRLGRQGSLRSP